MKAFFGCVPGRQASSLCLLHSVLLQSNIEESSESDSFAVSLFQDRRALLSHSSVKVKEVSIFYSDLSLPFPYCSCFEVVPIRIVYLIVPCLIFVGQRSKTPVKKRYLLAS